MSPGDEAWGSAGVSSTVLLHCGGDVGRLGRPPLWPRSARARNLTDTPRAARARATFFAESGFRSGNATFPVIPLLRPSLPAPGLTSP